MPVAGKPGVLGSSSARENQVSLKAPERFISGNHRSRGPRTYHVNHICGRGQAGGRAIKGPANEFKFPQKMPKTAGFFWHMCSTCHTYRGTKVTVAGLI